MTPIAAEGLPLTPRLRTLIGQDADHLANLIWRAHKEAEFNTKAAAAGLELIVRNFNAEHVRSSLQTALNPADQSATKGNGLTKGAAIAVREKRASIRGR
jgi:hypothetical protein